MKKFFLTLLAASSLTGVSAVTPLWLRDVKLSPDGKQIAFTYKGDIYKVNANGGQAVRLTTNAGYDSRPVWSPDGSKIAFASDRHGGKDVYIMSSDGGQAKRLTYNSANETPESFSPDGSEVYFSATIQDPASSASFPTRSQAEVYAVSVDGGKIRQILATPAENISIIPQGNGFVYENVKGFEDKWRKHHTSSITRDIWRYDTTTGQHLNLTSHDGEDRCPVVSADGSTLYFLSERDGGSFNLYSTSLDRPVRLTQLTDFDTHPLRFLSIGGNDLLAFTYDGEIYTLAPGGHPSKVAIDITEDEADSEKKISVTNARESAVSPDGKQVAFTNRGEVFVTSVEYPSTKQVTHTTAAEYGLSWSKDGRELYYTSDRSGRPNIYCASIVRKDDPNFSNATLIEEELVMPADGVERAYPQLSPDGKKLAYIEDRNKLRVKDLATGEVRELTSGNTTNYRTGGFDVVWSPDSRWLLLEIMNPLHEPYGDIAIINVATGEMIPLTATGYFDERPRWALDGNAVLFASERYGMRNHASWGSEYDVMMVFLNNEAYDRFRLNEEDYALLKEVEKQQKKDAPKSKEDDKKSKNDKKSKKDGGKSDKSSDKSSDDNSAVKPIVVDVEGIQDRVVRLTPNSSDLADFILTDDGETLYYLSAFEKGYDLWKKHLRKGDVSLVKKLGSGHASMASDKDGNIFLLGSSIKKMNPKGESMKNVSINTSMKMDTRKEREYLLEYLRNEARERFYLPDMGIDWDAYVDAYAKFLPHISNNYDFADLMSELLGELNVSHSGGRYSAPGAMDATASLGLLFDLTAPGKGLTVEEIVKGGPFDRATTRVKPGDVVESINGVALTDSIDWAEPLNNTAKRKTLVGIYSPSSGQRWEEVVLPISAGALNNLLYNRWVKRNEAVVDSLSSGRLGYVHIRSMDDNSFRKVYSALLGRYVGKEGVVIDTRWNGGGRLHEDIEVLFSGEKYLTQEIHGRESSEMPSRRWNKPSIMIIGEANYSNAHGTPWVYKHKKLGKLVGMPVPGTMSSVNWITLQDPSLVFGVPVVAFRTAEGTYLENSQLEPDVKVANDPAELVKGRDAQLETAVTTLLNDLDAKK